MRLPRFLICLALTIPLFAGAVDKKPWLWTAEERARARLDPELRVERVRQAQKERGANRLRQRSDAATTGDRVPADVIDGRTHPELFFPTQLFEKLVRMAFVTQPKVYPRVVAQETSDLFRNPAEWARFAEITRDYARLLGEEHRRLYGGPPMTADSAAEVTGKLRSAKCVAQGRALRNARHAFGRERFDRFLYDVVAAATSSTYISVETLQQSVNALRDREEKCRRHHERFGSR